MTGKNIKTKNQNRLKIYWSLLAVVLLFSSAPLSAAQTAPAVPEAKLIDQFGINLLTAKPTTDIPLVSIGSGSGALSHSTSKTVFNGSNTSYVTKTAPASGNEYSYNIAVPGGSGSRFIATTGTPSNSTVFTEYVKRGNSLKYNNGSYIYTGRNGTIATFSQGSGSKKGLSSVTGPDGTTTTYTYFGSRLNSVANNLGYQLKFQTEGSNQAVYAINNAVKYCNPSQGSCYINSTWAKATGHVSSDTLVDAENRNYSFYSDYDPMVGELYTYIERPGQYQQETFLYDPYNGELMDYVPPGGEFGAYYLTTDDTMGTTADEDDERTVTMERHADGLTRTVVSKIKGNFVLSDTGQYGQTTYTYTNNNLIETITSPRGASVHYSYDGRGNVTEVRRKSAPGAGSAPDIVTKAQYPNSCTNSNQVYCNKPIWTRDARGKQTDYTYHSQSGQVLTMTGPSAGNGLPRPKTVYSYAQYRAKVKNSNGAFVDAAPVWKIQTSRNYADSSNEITKSYTYDVNKNLTLSTVTTSSAGVSALTTTMSYDNFGNLITTDGPLPGTGDLVATFYDKLRRPIGSVGTDPDGGGAQKRSAARITYNDSGLAALTESGTTSGYTLSALNSMSVVQSKHNIYNSHLQPLTTYVKAGGTIQALQDYSYDDLGRLVCSATRMNKANFSATSSDACNLNAAGSEGPDRIIKRVYDAKSRVIETISGYGTPDAASQKADYYAYGPVENLYDGEDNQTHYTYDGFNRSIATYYPSASTGNWNSGDYEKIFYDAYGRAFKTRARNGDVTILTLDNAGQTTHVNAPGTVNDTSFSYTLTGQIASVTRTGQTLNYSYNNYGQLLSETSALGTVSYQYDAYGRRTRMNYPGGDNFHVTYDYHTGGQVSAIRENGTQILASYSYDVLGRRNGITRGNSGNMTTFNFDAASRLESMVTNLSGTAADQTVDFTYNAAGQIATQTNSNPIYDTLYTPIDMDFTVNSLNQILTMDGDPFTHDASGNLKTAQGKTYAYDASNRLTTVSGGPNAGSLTYDPLSRLSTVTGASGPTTGFLYDGQDVIAEYDNGVLTKRYVHGPGTDEPIAEYSGTDLNETFLIADVRGSIVAHADGATSIATNRYEIYGKPGVNNTGRFQYTGQMWLEEVGLYYYKARFYDPEIRRFLTPDPIGYGDGMNIYAYVGGDPVNRRDPSGLSVEEIVVTGTQVDTFSSNSYHADFLRDFLNDFDWDELFADEYVQYAQVGGIGGALPKMGGCSPLEIESAKQAVAGFNNPHAISGNEVGGYSFMRPDNSVGSTSVALGGAASVDIMSKMSEIPRDSIGIIGWHTHPGQPEPMTLHFNFSSADVNAFANGSRYAGDSAKWMRPINEGFIMAHAMTGRVNFLKPGLTRSSLQSLKYSRDITSCAKP